MRACRRLARTGRHARAPPIDSPTALTASAANEGSNPWRTPTRASSTGPGQVEVQDLDYPKLELPEQNNRPLQHGVILRVVATNICGSDQHMVRGRTTAPGPDPGPRDHRRGRRGRPRRRVHQGRRPGQRPLQHRLRALPQLQGAQHRRLRERQPGPRRRRLRLCRHGRLAGRPGQLRDRPLRRLEPAQVPRPRPGHGEDP